MAKPVVENPGGLMQGLRTAMGFPTRSSSTEIVPAERMSRAVGALQRVNASIDAGGSGFGGFGYLPPQNMLSKMFNKRESARRALMRDLGYLMGEARWLAKYHPIVRQAIRIREYWTVGSGLNHKFRFPKGWTKRQKAAFDEVVVKGFLESTAMDKNRKCNVWMMDGLIQRTIDVSGSIVIVHRKIKVAEMRRRKLKIPLMVEQYEPDMIWLGMPPRSLLRNGETFRDGYAFDANDDPVALFMCSKHPSEGLGTAVRMDLYDNEGYQQVFHLFDPDRAGHLHGTPIAVSVVEIATDGADWWKSRTDRAREEAKVTRYVKMGKDVGAPVANMFVAPRHDENGEVIPVERSDETTPAVNMSWDEAEAVAQNIAMNLFGSVDNNSVPFMPNDWSIEAGQLSPSSDFGTYWKEIVRMIASGMDVPNSLAANDTSGGSFSADKIGLTNLKIGSRKRQLYLAYAYRAPLYAAAQRAAMALALIPNDDVICDTKADPFPVIEPEREANAAVTLMDAGLEALEDILMERGHDPEEHFEKIKRQIELYATIGVDMRPGSIKAKGGGAASSTAGQGDDTNADAKATDDKATEE